MYVAMTMTMTPCYDRPFRTFLNKTAVLMFLQYRREDTGTQETPGYSELLPVLEPVTRVCSILCYVWLTGRMGAI